MLKKASCRLTVMLGLATMPQQARITPFSKESRMAFQVRRVITGHDTNGKAVVKIDEVATHAFTGRPGATGINVWTTESFPANNCGEDDAGLRKAGTTLPNGTIFRMLEF